MRKSIGLLLVALVCATANLSAQQLVFHAAKDMLGDAIQTAQRDFSPDAQLAGIMFVATAVPPVNFEMDINTGEATLWMYLFSSAAMDSAVMVVCFDAQGLGIISSLEAGPESEGAATPLIQGDQWLDSDVVFTLIKANSAKQFFETQQGIAVQLAVLQFDSTVQSNIWTYFMVSTQDTIICGADAVTGTQISFCQSLVTAVEKLAAALPSGMDLFPSPLLPGTHSELQLTWRPRASEDLVIEASNSAGKLVFSQSVTAVSGNPLHVSIPATYFPSSGVYLLRVRSQSALRATGIVRVVK
ncbi:MAG: hypothetical protein IPP94_15530 [Ignavibacteria bacterium]|nr:hypothetical protein [Ignavibacteria bacterium]